MAPNVTHSETLDPDFRIMVHIDMEMGTFISNWTHCDYIATFLARTISHNRPDSVLFSNLFSSALNELLELTFRSRHAGGTFACRILRQDTIDRVELTFTSTKEEQRFFEQAIARIRGGDAEADYMSSLSGDPGPSRDILLVELAVSYGATVSINAHTNDTITLVVDLPLGNMTH
ncbi:hypothetical protein BA190_06605 [Labrys sp. WJW]|jgi:hypothetical protein|uniref:hypothetical protein n=1 Tax=Labrys sp. WJW TaxID=1737983 RepID=UPI00082C9806|nr:hypothetical protein [Labrys sp. WJW]OCC05759.1 hypothetical protein BA190_06605 [Labrys sp. WJW]